MSKSDDSACQCDMTVQDCCEMMTECIVVPFFQITTAPLNKVELQKDITVDYLNSYVTILNFETNESTTPYQSIVPSAEAPPGFQIPLLV